MNLDPGFLKSLWTVWLVLLFGGIVVWTLWPSRRREMRDNAMIPFKDEDA